MLGMTPQKMFSMLKTFCPGMAIHFDCDKKAIIITEGQKTSELKFDDLERLINGEKT